MLRILTGTLLLLLLAGAGPMPSQAVPRIAVFDFQLINTSPQPSTPAELARTRMLTRELQADFSKSGKYQVVSIAPVRAALAKETGIYNCSGCERPLARKLGAPLAAVGWVQKVSNLILNINLYVEDTKTGRRLQEGSVDIRGNTDISWKRGLRFLLQEHDFTSG